MANSRKPEQDKDKYAKYLVWTYEYPLTHGEVDHAVIRAWQKAAAQRTQQETNRGEIDFDAKNAAFDILGILENQSNNEKTTVNDRLDLLVASKPEEEAEENTGKTREYLDETEINKAAIKKWLRANGGQTNKAFIEDLLEGNAFGDEYLPGTGTPKGNWVVNGNNVQLELCMTYFALQRKKDIQHYIKLDSDGTTNDKTPIPFDAKQLIITDRPVMRAKTSIRLEVKDGVVTPKVVKLEIESYTDVLKKPQPKEAELQDEEDSVKKPEQDNLPRPQPKPSFFTRHPYVRAALIGAAIFATGAVIIAGAVAISILTMGIAPAVLGAGAAVGGLVGLSGAAGTATGLAAIGAVGFAALSGAGALLGSAGEGVRKWWNNRGEAKQMRTVKSDKRINRSQVKQSQTGIRKSLGNQHETNEKRQQTYSNEGEGKEKEVNTEKSFFESKDPNANNTTDSRNNSNESGNKPNPNKL